MIFCFLSSGDKICFFCFWPLKLSQNHRSDTNTHTDAQTAHMTQTYTHNTRNSSVYSKTCFSLWHYKLSRLHSSQCLSSNYAACKQWPDRADVTRRMKRNPHLPHPLYWSSQVEFNRSEESNNPVLTLCYHVKESSSNTHRLRDHDHDSDPWPWPSNCIVCLYHVLWCLHLSELPPRVLKSRKTCTELKQTEDNNKVGCLPSWSDQKD